MGGWRRTRRGAVIILVQQMREIVFEIHRAAEGGFWAQAVGYAIFTQAESLDELEAMIRDAVDCHFEPGEQRPEGISGRFVSALAGVNGKRLTYKLLIGSPAQT